MGRRTKPVWRIDAVSNSLGTCSDGYRRGRTSCLDSGPWAGTQPCAGYQNTLAYPVWSHLPRAQLAGRQDAGSVGPVLLTDSWRPNGLADPLQTWAPSNGRDPPSGHLAHYSYRQALGLSTLVFGFEFCPQNSSPP